jgi:phospholipid/cholesterol/gamma-HCH transport system permease protein
MARSHSITSHPMRPGDCSISMSETDKPLGMITGPVAQAGQCLLFLFRMLAGIRFSGSQILTVLQQTYLIGARSLVIIMICGFFVGMVLSLQAINALEQFGASDQVSLLVGKSLFRELGPVLTALLFAGRAGTSITAEIGLMKATNQIEAMELMAIDPIQRIALPRFAAGVISVPLLTAMFNALAILGSVVFAIGVMDMDAGIFWSKLQTGVNFQKDFMGGLWKSVIFGGTVSLVAVYFGYSARPTGAGVGTATTNTVVLSSVLILIFDFIMTSFLT